MPRITKRFDKELFSKYDELAKKYTTKLFEKNGMKVGLNDNRYKVDLVVSKDDKKLFYVECEIKKYIKAGELFKFDTLQIPQRKSKYCNLDLPTLFILWSECGKSYLCVWDKFVSKSPIAEVANKYVYKGEDFFQIDMSLVDNDITKAMERDAWINT